jgi:hypothetical protein
MDRSLYISVKKNNPIVSFLEICSQVFSTYDQSYFKFDRFEFPEFRRYITTKLNSELQKHIPEWREDITMKNYFQVRKLILDAKTTISLTAQGNLSGLMMIYCWTERTLEAKYNYILRLYLLICSVIGNFLLF